MSQQIDVSDAEKSSVLSRMREMWLANHPELTEAQMPNFLRREESTVTAAEAGTQPHTGLLIALWLGSREASQIAVSGGESPDDLHVTLAYCGDIAEMEPTKIAAAVAAVERVCAYRPPLTGQIAGYGRFNGSSTSDEKDVFYGAVDVPGLTALREEIVRELEFADIPVRAAHGFAPHVTLAYLERDEDNPVDRVESVALRFGTVAIKAGDIRMESQLGGFLPSVYSTASEGGSWKLFVEQNVTFAAPPESINVLPLPGMYTHPSYGSIAITRERNERFVDHFANNVYQQKLPIDIEHDGKMSGAVGYIDSLLLREDGSVDAGVTWTARGKSLIEAEAFRYFSPEWFDVWTEPASGQVYEDVLIGGAICVRPFFKENALRPLISSEGRLFTQDVSAGGRPTSTQLQPVTAGGEPVVSDEQSKSFAAMEKQLAERESAFAAQSAELETLKKAHEGSIERVVRLEQDARNKRFTDLAMGRGGDGDGAVFIGPVDKAVKDLVRFAEVYGEDSEEFKEHVAHQQELARSFKESKAFTGVGSGEQPAPSGLNDEINQKIKIVMAEDSALTRLDAQARVFKENPDLYNRYRKASTRATVSESNDD